MRRATRDGPELRRWPAVRKGHGSDVRSDCDKEEDQEDHDHGGKARLEMRRRDRLHSMR